MKGSYIKPGVLRRFRSLEAFTRETNVGSSTIAYRRNMKREDINENFIVDVMSVDARNDKGCLVDFTFQPDSPCGDVELVVILLKNGDVLLCVETKAQIEKMREEARR